MTATSLQDAVAALHRLHHARRWALRILVLAIAGSMIAALPLLLLAPRAAAAAILLVPAFWAAYLVADFVLAGRWRARTLHAWRTGGINLGILAESLRTLHTPPRRSTEALFANLPVFPASADRDFSPAQRAALAALSDAAWIEANAAGLIAPLMIGLLSSVGAAALIFALPPSAFLLWLAVCAPLTVPLGATIVRRASRRRARVHLAALLPAERAALPESGEVGGNSG